jgi:hypothetical protein
MLLPLLLFPPPPFGGIITGGIMHYPLSDILSIVTTGTVVIS